MLRMGISLALAMVTGVASHAILAQTSDGGPALEEVVVTAQRREQNLQDVAMSTQTFTSEAMSMRGLERVEDVVAAAPNVMVSAAANTSDNLFAMRGIPRAGFFVDDVWQQSNIVTSQRSVMELARVEVLRGPQGTLFGRDTTGGAIKLYTKLPAREFGVRATVTGGTYDRLDAIVHADIPLTDTLLSKLSVIKTDRDGYIDSITVDRSYGDMHDEQVRADFLWTPTDEFQARLTIGDQRFEGTQANVTRNIFDPGQPGVDAGFIDPKGRSLFWVPNSQYYQLAGVEFNCQTHVMDCPGGRVGDLETTANYTEGPGIIVDRNNYNLKLEYDITRNINISSLSHYHEEFTWSYNHFDGADLDYFSQGNLIDREGWSQEIQITGDHDRIHWLVGLYAWDEETYNHFIRWALWEFVTGELDFADVANSPECQSWDPSSGLNPCVQVPPSQDSMTYSQEDGYAVFGQVTYDITETLSLTLGARYHEQENRDATVEFSPETGRRPDVPGRKPAGDPFANAGLIDPLDASFDQDTYRVSVQNDFSPQVMGYFNFSQGYNAGGVDRVQIFDLDNNAIYLDQPFDPEQIDNYEIGLRSDWLNGTLRANLTGFFTQWEQIQLDGTVVNPFTGLVLPTYLTTNAAEAEAKGMEAELTWAPITPLILELDIGYLSTEYTNVSEDSELSVNADFGMAPELQTSFGAQWNHYLANNAELTFRFDYMWTDGYNRTYVPGDWSHRFMEDGDYEVESYGLINARIIYRPPEGNWQVAVFGTNLTDERYADGGFMSPLLQVDDATIGRPREAGVTFRFDL